LRSGQCLVDTGSGEGCRTLLANLDYPEFNARIHLSYKKIDGNLAQYIDDSHKMAMKTIARSSGIREHFYEHPERRVFGTLYDKRGTAAASPLQFYVTDSTRHFLRGALYFNLVPNNDSLAPVISYIEEDIRHLLETLHWKQD
jgi:gliding motility-associated lipoprotein GldD